MYRWKYVALVALFAGCDSGTSPPLAGCPDGPDDDADGVCDDIDVCPHAYDPGQADLDGDGIGFVCDPVESFALSGPGLASLGGNANTVAASVGVGNIGYVIAAGPGGQFIGGSYNDQLQDPWLAAEVGGIRGPVVSSEGAIFFSYGDERFDTVILDLAQHAFLSRGEGAITDSGDVRIPSELVLLRTMGRVAANVPMMDQLTEVAAGHDILVQPSTSGVFGMNISDTGIGSYEHGEYKRVVDALNDVVSFQPNAYFLTRPRYCAYSQGELPAAYTLLETRAASAPLPFASCAAIRVYESPSTDRVYIEGDMVPPSANRTLVVVRDDEAVPIYADEPQNGVVRITGEELQVVTRTFAADNSGKAWIVTPADTVIAIPETLYGVTTSIYGDTVHIVGVRSVTNGFGPTVVYRYRESTGLEHVDLMSNSATLVADPTLITTHEGAAIVESGGVWAVPSTSMTPTTLALSYIQGGVRGDATVIAGTAPAADPAVYAYDEIGGPRIVRLTPEQQGLGAALIDSPYRASPWIVLHDTADKIARVVYEGDMPKLEAFPVAQLFNLRIVGQRANGDFIATDDKEVYVFGAAGVEHVASFASSQFVNEPMILDYKTVPPTIVGWMGTRPDRNVVCLASHPERCWDVPGDDLQQVKSVYVSTEGDGDFRIVSSATVLATVRALGTGTAPQPL